MPKDPLVGEAGRLGLGIAGTVLFGPLGGTVGAIIGGFLFPPTVPQTAIASFHLTGAHKGQPLKVLWGCNKIQGDYIWYGNFQTIAPSSGKKGGKGGKGSTTTATTYTVGLGVALCEGADPDSVVRQHYSLKRIWSGKDIIWSADGSVGGGLNFTFYEGLPGQGPDPYMAQFTGTQAQSSVLSSDIGPVGQEHFTATGTGGFTYYVNNPPIATGSDAVWWDFTDPNTGYAVQMFLNPTTATTPAQGEYTINDANGFIVLGPAPPLFEGDNSHDWNGQTVFIQYQQAQGVITSAIGNLYYPHTCYIVFEDFHLGNTTAPPNFHFEVCTSAGMGDWAGGMDQDKHVLFADPAQPPVSYPVPTEDAASSTVGVLLTAHNFYKITTYSDNSAFVSVSVAMPPTTPPGWSAMATLHGADFGPEHVVGSKIIQAADGSFLVNAMRQVRFSGDGRLYILRSPTGLTGTWTPVLVDNISVPGFSEVDLNVENIERLSTGTLLMLVRYYGYFPAQESAYVYRSGDNGQTWHQVFTYGPLGLFQYYDMCALQVIAQDGFVPVAFIYLSGSVSNYGYVWRSGDDGQTWQYIQNAAVIDPGTHFGIAKRDPWEKFGDFPTFIWKINPNPTTPTGSLMMSWNDIGGGQVRLVSADNGVTWSVSAAFPSNFKYIDGTVSTPTALYGWVQLTSAAQGALHLYQSTDNGATWTDTGFTAGIGGATLQGPLWTSLALGAAAAVEDVNPVDCVYDTLLNSRFGLGDLISASDIDQASYQTTREYVASQGIFVSPILDTQQSGLRCLEELLLYYDGWLLFSQGLVKFGVRKPGVPANIFGFPDNQYNALPHVTRAAPKDSKNRVVIEWTDRSNFYNQAFVQLFNDSDIRDTGERQQQYTMRGITTPQVAKALVARAFATLSVRKITLSHGIDPKWGLLEPGDIYAGDFPGVNVTDKSFRIQVIKEDVQWGLALESIEDPILVAATVPATTESGGAGQIIPTFGIQQGVVNSTPPTTVPVPATNGFIVEIPQEISGTQGPMLMAYASSSGTAWFGSTVSISRDGGVTYTQAGTIGPVVSGVLTAPMYLSDVYAPDQQVSVDVSESQGQLVSMSPAQFFQWQTPLVVGVTPSAPAPVAANQDYEGTMYNTAQLISGHRYLLTGFQRGIYHTVPQTWPAGTHVLLMTDAGLRIPIAVSDIGKTLYFKFVSESRFGSQVVSAAASYLTFTPQGLGVLPAPVSQLQIVRPDGVAMAQMESF